MGRDPGPRGVRRPPASGTRGGIVARTVSAAPGAPHWPPRGPGAGEGEPRFPLGWGPPGINPSGADRLIVIPSLRRPVPPRPPHPRLGCQSGVCSGPPPRSRSPEPGGGAAGRRGGASGRGVGGTSGLVVLHPPTPCRPLPSPTRAPALRLRPPVSASSLTPLRPFSLPDLELLFYLFQIFISTIIFVG